MTGDEVLEPPDSPNCLCLHAKACLLLESGVQIPQSDNKCYSRAVANIMGGFRSMQEHSAGLESESVVQGTSQHCVHRACRCWQIHNWRADSLPHGEALNRHTLTVAVRANISLA